MGAPVGNTNATKNKPWAEALARINIQSDGVKLRKIAEKLYELAEAGDIQAIREVADRMDGKAMQGIEVSGPDGEPVKLQSVDWNIVAPKS